jgi:hypothetical protein
VLSSIFWATVMWPSNTSSLWWGSHQLIFLIGFLLEGVFVVSKFAGDRF